MVNYLTHCYAALVILPSSQAVKLTADGLERYLAGERTVECLCCAGERER